MEFAENNILSRNMGKIDLSAQLKASYGRHRSGWKYALQQLKSLHNPDGYYFDSFIERSFVWDPGGVHVHFRPWIGVVHVPPRVPEWFMNEQSNQAIFNSEHWKKSIPFCQGLFTLSEYHKKELEKVVDVPVCALTHPTSFPKIKWNWDRFRANECKKIVQVGWWLRRLNSIYLLKTAALGKVMIKPDHLDFIDDLIFRERKLMKRTEDFSASVLESVQTVGYLSDLEYDQLLAENLVFLDLYDSSANNSIIECMARNTPVLVNPLPAVIEYLGKDYPFYYSSLEEAAMKAENDSLVHETHEYLVGLKTKEKIRGSCFLKSFVDSSIYQNLEDNLGTRIRKLENSFSSASRAAKKKEREISNRNRYIENLEKQVEALEMESDKKDSQIFELEKKLNYLGTQAEKLEEDLYLWKAQCNENSRRLRGIRKSRSFRAGRMITAPIRLCKKKFPTPDPMQYPVDVNRVAFIDHSFHRKSGATSFLIELLKTRSEVRVFWDRTWKGKGRISLKKILRKGFGTLVLFQVYDLIESELHLLKRFNLVVIPMFDGSGHREREFWLPFSQAKFVNFSACLHKKMKSFGLKSRYFKYYPNPDDYKDIQVDFAGLKAFFWQRTDRITWKHIKKLIGEADIKQIHIHKAVDPPGYGIRFPSRQEIEAHNISFSNWFRKKAHFLAQSKKFNICFVSRMYEGIGMSFLEAMAMGKCVVAPDLPTMNEYIVSGESGILYDPDHLQPVDFSNAKKMGEIALNQVRKGYQEWQRDRQKMLDFVFGGPKK